MNNGEMNLISFLLDTLIRVSDPNSFKTYVAELKQFNGSELFYEILNKMEKLSQSYSNRISFFEQISQDYLTTGSKRKQLIGEALHWSLALCERNLKKRY